MDVYVSLVPKSRKERNKQTKIKIRNKNKHNKTIQTNKQKPTPPSRSGGNIFVFDSMTWERLRYCAFENGTPIGLQIPQNRFEVFSF